MSKSFLILLFFICSFYCFSQADGSTQESLGKHFFDKALAYNKKGQSDSSVAEYKKAIRQLRLEQDYAMLFRAYGSIVLPLYSTSQFNELYAYSDSALALANEHDFPLLNKLSILHNRSSIYEEMGLYERKLQTLLTIKRLLPDTGYLPLSAVCFMGLARHHADYGNNHPYFKDSAIYYSQKALKSSAKARDTTNWAQSSFYLAVNLAKKGGHLDSIKPLLDFPERIYRNSGFENSYLLCRTLILRAKCYYFLGMMDKALDGLVEPEELSLSNKYPGHLLSVLNLKYFTLKEKGQFEKALNCQDKYYQLEDSISKANSQAEMARLEVGHQTREKEYQLKLSKAENALTLQKNRRLLFALIGLTLLGLLGATLIWVLIRNKRKVAIERERKFQLELSNKELLEQKLQSEIDFKSRQLTTKALEISRLAENAQQIIEQVKKTTQENPSELSRVLQTWERKLKTFTNWNDFHKSFVDVHPSFFGKLLELQPELTEKEKRLLAFAKLGLNIKEVAHLMAIEPNSVKTARYRLKKKFNLENSESLDGFLATL